LWSRGSARKIFEDDGNPAFVRNLEMFRAVKLLGRKIKNNAMLLGESGVGKTTVIESLTFAAIDQWVPPVYISEKDHWKPEPCTNYRRIEKEKSRILEPSGSGTRI
jgi:septin family protein